MRSEEHRRGSIKANSVSRLSGFEPKSDTLMGDFKLVSDVTESKLNH